MDLERGCRVEPGANERIHNDFFFKNAFTNIVFKTKEDSKGREVCHTENLRSCTVSSIVHEERITCIQNIYIQAEHPIQPNQKTRHIKRRPLKTY